MKMEKMRAATEATTAVRTMTWRSIWCTWMSKSLNSKI